MHAVKIHLTRDQKFTFDHSFEESPDLPKRHMPSIQAVWVMPSVGCQHCCHTLSTPIREPIPNISDWRTSRYTFAAGFNAAKPEKKTIDSTKALLKVYHGFSQLVNNMTRIKEIRFREVWNWQKIWIFSTNLDNRKPGADPSRVQTPSDSFFAKKINTVTPKQSLRQTSFKKSYCLAEEEQMANYHS